jgi:hypothetical protein
MVLGLLLALAILSLGIILFFFIIKKICLQLLVNGATYYVRTDGGTRYSDINPTGQCSGLVDAAWNGDTTQYNQVTSLCFSLPFASLLLFLTRINNVPLFLAHPLHSCLGLCIWRYPLLVGCRGLLSMRGPMLGMGRKRRRHVHCGCEPCRVGRWMV